MTIDDQFHAMAAARGWSTEVKLDVLLDYIARQDSDATFLDFIAQQDAEPVMENADHFLWTVAERLQHPGLVIDPRFQRFCLNTFDLFTADEAAAEWQRRNEAHVHRQGDLP